MLSPGQTSYHPRPWSYHCSAAKRAPKQRARGDEARASAMPRSRRSPRHPHGCDIPDGRGCPALALARAKARAPLASYEVEDRIGLRESPGSTSDSTSRRRRRGALAIALPEGRPAWADEARRVQPPLEHVRLDARVQAARHRRPRPSTRAAARVVRPRCSQGVGARAAPAMRARSRRLGVAEEDGERSWALVKRWRPGGACRTCADHARDRDRPRAASAATSHAARRRVDAAKSRCTCVKARNRAMNAGRNEVVKGDGRAAAVVRQSAAPAPS